MVPQFVDMSQFQPVNIDWKAYKAWSASVDGVSRVAMRSSYGNGYEDPHFAAYRAGALAVGIDEIYYYHYSYPQDNSADYEANWQRIVVGNIRPQDLLILDFEESVAQATAEWAYEWLVQQERNYGKLSGIYASSAYIAQRLQDARLAKYPLWLANWQYTPDERPTVPYPWTSYQFVQFTDKATNIPGIPGTVDCNIFLGKETPMSTIPAGWSDDGTTLKAPDGTEVKLGFRDHILNSNWDPNNIPLEPEQHLPILEQSNPSLGVGQRQICRKTSLEYTPKNGVFEGWMGQELEWYIKQHALLQGENTALKALIASSNLGQISALGKQIQDNVALIMKLSQIQ